MIYVSVWFTYSAFSIPRLSQFLLPPPQSLTRAASLAYIECDRNGANASGEVSRRKPAAETCPEFVPVPRELSQFIRNAYSGSHPRARESRSNERVFGVFCCCYCFRLVAMTTEAPAHFFLTLTVIFLGVRSPPSRPSFFRFFSVFLFRLSFSSSDCGPGGSFLGHLWCWVLFCCGFRRA